MKEYIISVHQIVRGCAVVEANNEEEAREKFLRGEEKSFEEPQILFGNEPEYIIDDIEESED